MIAAKYRHFNQSANLNRMQKSVFSSDAINKLIVYGEKITKSSIEQQLKLIQKKKKKKIMNKQQQQKDKQNNVAQKKKK